MTSKKQKTRQVVKTGDVIAIPLPDGRLAFGLQMDDVTAIYSKIGNNINEAPLGHRKFLFATGVYRDALSSTEWIKVAKDAVTQEEIDFAKISYLKDAMSGGYTLSSEDDAHLNGIPSTRDECYGLEPVAVWDSHHIVDRIMDTLAAKKSDWLTMDDWIPFALDMSASGNFKRVPITEVLQ